MKPELVQQDQKVDSTIVLFWQRPPSSRGTKRWRCCRMRRAAAMRWRSVAERQVEMSHYEEARKLARSSPATPKRWASRWCW